MTVDLNNLTTQFWMAITFFGSSLCLSLLTLFLYLRCLQTKRRFEGIYIAFTYVAGEGVVHLLKEVFRYQRPPSEFMLVGVSTYSFPSGHAFLSTAVVSALVMIFLPSRKTRPGLIGVLVLMPLLVGISRIQLGVHYISDVVAGWLLGLTWSMLCYKTLQKFFAQK